MKHHFDLFDIVRIDHFRGLVNFWAIPADEPTAIKGTWVDVPATDFIDALRSNFEKLPVIAEDLGIISDEVRVVMKSYHFPGMKILLFAFNGDMQTHPYLPHNFKDPCVVYTGTHDNNTVIGWYQTDAQPQEKLNLSAYINKPLVEEEVHWDLIELALSSPAMMAIFPMQDVLGLDGSCRMNQPGIAQGNWGWRMKNSKVTPDIKKRLHSLTKKYQRAAD